MTKPILRAAKLFLVLFVVAISAAAQKERTIAEVQGDKNTSPFVGTAATVTGVVTARTRTGFFLQTPDDKIDASPATSEGIFVFTGSRAAVPADAVVGSLVAVTGTVEEFRRDSEPFNLTITEISLRPDRDPIRIVSKSAVLPKPVTLTAADFAPNTLDQLEKYEGMRVAVAEMTVVAPTGGREDTKSGIWSSDNIFYGVLKGMARPFREPGIDIRETAALTSEGKLQKEKYKPQIFDGNPETIRVDASEQEAVKRLAFDVAAMSQISGLTGVLHYVQGKYTLLTDPDIKPTVTTNVKAVPMPPPADRQFSIVGMNVENFFDDRDDPTIKEPIVPTEAFARRLRKISATVRELLKMPDIIGTVETENLAALKRLADKINADAVAAGNPDPKYAAYLIDGNDGRGIDSGFLVKSSRVTVREVKQFGKSETYDRAAGQDDAFLNDRPPLMLRAAINDPRSGQPFEFIVVVNHLKSFNGYSNPRQQDNVRNKKRLQAEFLARWVDSRQKADPKEKIVLIGDFNFFQFPDGIMDVIGTIKGAPAPKDALIMPSDDLVNPDLTNLVDVIDIRQRYSYSFDGNAQAIDHMLVTESFKRNVSGYGYLRVNVDYPEIFRNDASRPERFADHDPAVAYFTFDSSEKR